MNTLIVALGPNDVSVPCLAFLSEEKARNFLAAQGLSPVTTKGGKEIYYSSWEDDDPRWDAFFIGHYFGCGGVWAFQIVTPQEAIPFVCFDLD